MKAYVSLWSADALNLERAIDAVDEVIDGYHLDVMDGHLVPDLLFGPHFVEAVRRKTAKLIEVHLMVADADGLVRPCLEAGADMLTVHEQSTPDIEGLLAHIADCGMTPSLGLTVDRPLEPALRMARVRRLLLMGTAIGIKGVELHESTYQRVADAVRWRQLHDLDTEVFVDGGIRAHTVGRLAQAGADGVIPGSLVFAAEDPAAAVSWLHSLGASSLAASTE